MRISLRAGHGKRLLVSLLIICFTVSVSAQDTPGSASVPAPSSAPSQNNPSAPAQSSATVSLQMPKSRNPLSSYTPSFVPEPQLANSPLLTQLIRDGKLYLSLKDAIRLALENNLDCASATASPRLTFCWAGGVFRGVNAGVVQNTPGGGVGRSDQCTRCRSRGTTGGAGGARWR
jgi:hypothetical protein